MHLERGQEFRLAQEEFDSMSDSCVHLCPAVCLGIQSFQSRGLGCPRCSSLVHRPEVEQVCIPLWHRLVAAVSILSRQITVPKIACHKISSFS